MAASDFLPDRIVSVYHTPKDIDDLDKFVDSFLRTLDVFDNTKGFSVLNDKIHKVPCGSILLWPHLRFTPTALTEDACEERLRNLMKSHLSKIKKECTHFQINYGLLA